ncbi:uncharacterized protein LOC141532616 [Cotesia typhae]|uniref:uncharacterized protein LOC141532616 n=1 Tax=Cotesia typhae TaxID=2053667 RepID=UPI003D69D69C
MDNFMVTCKYNWKNHCYEITDTKGFHEKIKKDCSFAKSLFDKLENQKFKTKGNTIVVPDNNCKDQDENFEEKHVEEEHVTDCAEDGGTEFCNKRKGIDESKTVKGVDSKGKKMKASKTKEVLIRTFRVNLHVINLLLVDLHQNHWVLLKVIMIGVSCQHQKLKETVLTIVKRKL